MTQTTAIRAALLTFECDPFVYGAEASSRYESDAVVVMEGGLIRRVGTAAELLPQLDGVPLKHYPDSLIVPGFIDAHVHYPQTVVTAAYGAQLLDWLNHYTFPAEEQFADKAHAAQTAQVFLREQLRHGVTSSAVYCTVFPQSVDALFEAAAPLNMRILAGKVCMDRNAPAALTDTPQRAYDESKALISRWHGQGRAEYVITPRFIPTSSPEQMEMIAALAVEHPDMAVQSHIAENEAETAWVKRLCPEARDYTDAYARYGLLRPRAVYGHGIHLSERELAVFHETGAALAHCPTSNFFLGSGCLNVQRAKEITRPLKIGLATDIGAGTSFSILHTMGAAYQAAQMNGAPYTALHAFYLATRGAAEALGLAGKIGSVRVGLEADLAVINLQSTPLIAHRMQYVRDLQEALFVQMIMADDRAIAATYVAGKEVYAA